MRRMNSMLLGHQGASGRTDCVYLRMASCVAGSSQESGRWTMREGTTMSSRSGMRRSHGIQRVEQRLAAEAAAVVMDVQGADAGVISMMPGRRSARRPASSAWTRKRRLRSSTLGPYSTSRYLSPSARSTTAGATAGGRGPGTGSALRGWARLGFGATRRQAFARACVELGFHGSGLGFARPRGSGRCRRACSWPIFQSSACDDGGGADEAAQAGTVGAEDDRHVAGEIDRADGVGVVVDVGGVQAGFAAIASRPCGLRADEADAGAVGIVVDLPGGGEERLDVAGGEEIGRAVRAVEHADLPVV